MSLTPLLLTFGSLLSSPALAGSKPASTFSSEVGTATVPGQVEVEAYGLPGNDGVVGIQVDIEGKPYLFALAPGGDQIVLGPRVQGALGLALKKDKTWDSTKVDELKIGAATLQDVDALFVASLALPTPGPSAPRFNGELLISVDGILGMAALEGVSWSILPSTSKVVLGAALAKGASLVAGEPIEDTVVKTAAGKVHLDGCPLPFTATVGTTDNGTVCMTSQQAQSLVDARSVGADDLRRSHGDQDERYTTLRIGEFAHQDWVLASTSGVILALYPKAPEPPVAVLGTSALAGVDLSFDATSRTLTFGRHGTDGLKAAATGLLADALTSLEQAQKPDDGSAAVPETVAAAASRLARIQLAAGDVSGALTTWALVPAADPASCSSWLEHGMAQRLLADAPATAVDALQKAEALYRQWWQWDTEVRLKLAKAVDKADKREEAFVMSKEDVGFVKVRDIDQRDVRFGAAEPGLPADGTTLSKQPGACHVAPTELAAAALLGGDLSTASGAAADLDLDAGLARVSAVALLAEGNHAGAQAVLRQAVKRELGNRDARNRLGLGLAYAGLNDPETAAGHFARAVELAPDDVTVHDARLAHIAAWKGDAAALELASTVAKAAPRSPAAAAAWVRAAKRQGAPLTTPAAWADNVVAVSIPSPESTALQARIALDRGATDQAAALITEAVAAAPLSPLVHAVHSEVVAGSDPAAAMTARKRAAQRDPQHPAFALPAPAGS